MITLEDLKSICPTTKLDRLALCVDGLNKAMLDYEMNTPDREAMFLSQCAHESGGFNYMEEIASGAAYEGRSDLGNTEDGDGKKFKGLGWIQNTGRANHTAYAKYKGMTVDEALDYERTHEGAADVSGWFWMTRNCNDLCDRGDYLRLTRRINGGLNGYAERQAYLVRAQKVIA